MLQLLAIAVIFFMPAIVTWLPGWMYAR
jgi:hypothetical protein